jgi:hypothetical protein
MKKLNISVIALTIGVLLIGCKKSFLDINQDPNTATEASITPELALPPQLTAVAGRNASSWDPLSRWLGYWSASGSYSRATVEMSYNITNDFGSGVWNGVYYTVGQLKTLEKKAESLNWKFYQGIAIILQAHEMGVLVDLYNNVPYSKAVDLAGNIRPAYDKGEDVYKDLMTRIDAGLALIKAADGSDSKIGTVDILFKGDKAKWAKFANTLKLRLLIHTVKSSTFNAAAEIAKITAEGSGFLGDGVGAMVQPGYTPDKPNPYYNAHFFSIAGAENDNYNRANNFSLNLMKDLGDERYKRLYRECKALPGQWRGTDYGQNPLDDVNSDRTSGPGYGITASASAPMWIMTSVEAMFLRAEAVARGWLPGDAQAAYEAAVKESFVFLGVPNADATATTYLSSPNSKIAWPASGTEADKIAVIMWQKYFALNGIQANETWTDIRRLGVVVPPLSLAPERGSNTIPIRWLYPTTEYNYNEENVKGEGTVSQFTTNIFWDK